MSLDFASSDCIVSRRLREWSASSRSFPISINERIHFSRCKTRPTWTGISMRRSFTCRLNLRQTGWMLDASARLTRWIWQRSTRATSFPTSKNSQRRVSITSKGGHISVASRNSLESIESGFGWLRTGKWAIRWHSLPASLTTTLDGKIVSGSRRKRKRSSFKTSIVMVASKKSSFARRSVNTIDKFVFAHLRFTWLAFLMKSSKRCVKGHELYFPIRCNS